jgi:rhamnose transport system permease protein
VSTTQNLAGSGTDRLHRSMPRQLFAALWRWEALLIVLLVLTSLINAELSPDFLSLTNFADMAVTFMPVGLMVLPLTFIILIAGIDLSVASILGLSGVALGLLFAHGANVWLAVAGALAVGALAGLVNGLAIAVVRLPALIVTLATLGLFRGLAYGLIGEQAVFGFPDSFDFLGQGSIPGTGIPAAIVIFAAGAAIFTVVLHRTVFGRTIYAVGNNETASRYSGLGVDRLKLMLYVLSGIMSAVAGVIMTAHFDSVRGDTGTGLELDAITAVLLGGVSVFGGKGSMVGPVIALFLIGEVRYGMNLQNIAAQEQTIAIGLLLILSVLLTELFRRDWARHAGGSLRALVSRPARAVPAAIDNDAKPKEEKS